MLQNTRLVEFLGQKNSWSIDLYDYDCIFQVLPSMTHITTRLILHNFIPNLFVKTPAALKDFQNLEHLELLLCEPIAIAQLPSSLRTLVIKSDMWLSCISESQIFPDLHQVQNLHEYSYTHLAAYFSYLDQFLPLGSSETLSTLTFSKLLRDRFPEDQYDILDTFRNLESSQLHIRLLPIYPTLPSSA
jgi:hypothetical protein